MSGEVLNGSSCGIHGCQRVTITHRGGGDMKAVASMVGDGLSVKVGEIGDGLSVSANSLCSSDVTANRIDTKTSASFSLVCRTSQGLWEYLMVREGEIMLIDGQRVMVKRKR